MDIHVSSVFLSYNSLTYKSPTAIFFYRPKFKRNERFCRFLYIHKVLLVAQVRVEHQNSHFPGNLHIRKVAGTICLPVRSKIVFSNFPLVHLMNLGANMVQFQSETDNIAYYILVNFGIFNEKSFCSKLHFDISVWNCTSLMGSTRGNFFIPEELQIYEALSVVVQHF